MNLVIGILVIVVALVVIVPPLKRLFGKWADESSESFRRSQAESCWLSDESGVASRIQEALSNGERCCTHLFMVGHNDSWSHIRFNPVTDNYRRSDYYRELFCEYVGSLGFRRIFFENFEEDLLEDIRDGTTYYMRAYVILDSGAESEVVVFDGPSCYDGIYSAGKRHLGDLLDLRELEYLSKKGCAV